jgi:hypothetical protein
MISGLLLEGGSIGLIIIMNIIIRISHSSALAGKYSPIMGCIINRIRLGCLMSNLGNFLQLNMYQELPLFAFVFMCLGAGYVSLDFVTVTSELFPQLK